MASTIRETRFVLAKREERFSQIWQLPVNFYEEIVQPLVLQHPPTRAISTIDSQSNLQNLFKTVPQNIVQSIRAFRVQDLASVAYANQQHFLYADCATAQNKAEVLETVAHAFGIPMTQAKNLEALKLSLTEVMFKAGKQYGFVIVLERLPYTQKFDKEAREILLDVFRDAADFWHLKGIPFRVFYAFI